MCTCVVPYLSHWSDRHLLMRGSLDKQTAEKYIFARHLATRHVSASLLMFYAQAILKQKRGVVLPAQHEPFGCVCSLALVCVPPLESSLPLDKPRRFGKILVT